VVLLHDHVCTPHNFTIYTHTGGCPLHLQRLPCTDEGSWAMCLYVGQQVQRQQSLVAAAVCCLPAAGASWCLLLGRAAPLLLVCLLFMEAICSMRPLICCLVLFSSCSMECSRAAQMARSSFTLAC
jgi:hypothetical protein